MHSAEGTMDSPVEEVAAQYYTMFPNVKTMVYKGTTLLNTYLNVADAIENFEVNDDHVFIAGFPKAGTSWAREMGWNIAHDLNFEGSKAVLTERVPLIEYSGMYIVEQDADDEDPTIYVKNLTNHKCIGTHLPYHLLPRKLRNNEMKSKVVYVTRNPKDVCISAYHFNKLIGVYTGDFEGYCELFLNNQTIQTPFWDHVRSYWNRRNDGNVLFLRYENMKEDLSREIKKTAKFLGKNYSEEQVSKLVEHLSFENMSKNPATNREELIKSKKNHGEGIFMRAGKADQWKAVMSKEMIERFDNWTRENLKNDEALLREFS